MTDLVAAGGRHPLFYKFAKVAFFGFLIAFGFAWIVVTGYFIAIIVKGAFPDLLNAHDEYAGSYLRNLLELGFFLVNIVVLPAGLAALIIAREHAREAANTRLATIYHQISARYLSKEITESRIEFAKLARQFPRGGPPLHDYLVRLRKENIERYAAVIALIFFFEDVSVLIKKKYVREDDMYMLLASALVSAYRFYEAHLIGRRDEASNVKLFEHFADIANRFEARLNADLQAQK